MGRLAQLGTQVGGSRMSRPLILDLFCCAGGAAVGYHRAGFDVVGIDIEPQPDYPFEFHQGNALTLGRDLLASGRFAAIHASPPCQTHSPISHYSNKVRRRELVDLLPETRELVAEARLPYVIENVHTRSAALRAPVVLCGSLFGLDVFRHRGFESNVPMLGPAHQRHTRLAMRNGYLPTAERPVLTITGRNGHHSKAWRVAAAAAMGTPWITTLNQVCEAIPPAYTEHIGEQLLDHIRAGVAA
jgi:DNA (cytosine-5)-methyltransferase 1